MGGTGTGPIGYLPFRNVDKHALEVRTIMDNGGILTSMIHKCPKSLFESGQKSERVDQVDKIKIEGLFFNIFKKKVLVYGRNKDYNSIMALHDYKTGKVLNEMYANF